MEGEGLGTWLRRWTERHTHAVDDVALCRVTCFRGETAECEVFMDGFQLPRVGFDASILRSHGLAVGGHFRWHPDEDTVMPCPAPSQGLTESERAELERLHEDMKRGLAEDGGVWPEYIGDGK